MTAERKIFISAAIYGILGLVAGFFGRIYTQSMGMEFQIISQYSIHTS